MEVNPADQLGEDRICHTKQALPVPCHALWALQCSKHISEPNGACPTIHWSYYLDDIIIFSKTIAEHLTRLTEVLTRLRESGLKIKQSKCYLLQKSIHYLGHVVSGKGVETDPSKIKCIAEWPTPSGIEAISWNMLVLLKICQKFCWHHCTAFQRRKKHGYGVTNCEQAFNYPTCTCAAGVK